MSKYEEKITDNSLWYTATPTPLTLTLPFYITEAGHFRAEADYKVERDEHDSYLLLYTIKGSGTVVSDKVSLTALPHNAVMINCHNYHKYFSNNEEWEFIWIHLKGSAVAAMFDILYSNAVNIISVKDFLSFEQQLSELICNVTKNDVLSSISTSSQILIVQIKPKIAKQTDQAFFILPTKGAKKEVYAMIPLPKATPTIAQNVLIVANRLLVS